MTSDIEKRLQKHLENHDGFTGKEQQTPEEFYLCRSYIWKKRGVPEERYL
jgi:hypothetical protein